MEKFKRKLTGGCRLFFLLAVAAVFLSSCENPVMQRLLGDLPPGPAPSWPAPAPTLTPTPASYFALMIVQSNLLPVEDQRIASISGFSPSPDFDGRLVIPAVINGLTIVGIGNNAFQFAGLTSVVIPDSVRTIGNNAFLGNNISSLTIGNNVQTIGAFAFQDNALQSVVIPFSVTDIMHGAFTSNPLTSISIGGMTRLNMQFVGGVPISSFPYGFDINHAISGFFGSPGRARFVRPAYPPGNTEWVWVE
ncbi:MAG: leucine-rich repeat domain-containing protein [Spirochaetes bacterium]|nr:leucine-rich repeat domain-containing protein [Spirochaetota bacterium]